MRVRRVNLDRITIHGWSRFKVVQKSHDHLKKSCDFMF